MNTLAISLLFSLLSIILFPLSLSILIFTALSFILLCLICAYFIPTSTKHSILIILGLLLACILAIPTLLRYQTVLTMLPHNDDYTFIVTKVNPAQKSADAKILTPTQFHNNIIRLYNINDDLTLNATYQSQFIIQPNRIKARFNTISPALNFLVNQRIGTTNLTNTVQLIESPSTLSTLRNNISDHFIQQKFTNAGLMSALSVGITHWVSQENWQLLRQTGTIHLAAISGLHLTFIALWCFIILKAFWGLCGIQKPAPYQVAAFTSLLFALGYALLAGMSLPTQRALIMFGIFMMALLVRYPILNLHSLASALLLILLLSPLSVVTIGLWLSFTAVLILMLLGQYKFSLITSILLTQGLISLLAIPIVASFFHEASLISPITNLFAIPWATLAILPTLLIGVIILPLSENLANILFTFSDHNITTLIRFLRVMQQIPMSTIEVPNISFISAILITLFSLLLLSRLTWVSKIYCGFGLVLSIGYTFRNHQEDYLLVLPVGEGLSALLKTQEQTLLFDTGTYFRGFDSANSTIIPILKNMKVQVLDNIVLSHNNQQHIGGTKTIRRAYPHSHILAHSSLQPLITESTNCNDYHFQGKNITIDPLKTEKSCAFVATVNQHVIWLIANITPREWRTLLRDNAKPDIVLFPNKGRSKGYTIPENWQDVITIASTKNIHQSYQSQILWNAYYGTIQVDLSSAKLNILDASTANQFWWNTKTEAFKIIKYKKTPQNGVSNV